MNAPSLLTLPGTSVPACCEDETWKPIPGWPHEASTCGRARSMDRLGPDGIWRLGAMLPAQPDKRPGKGYLYYDLRDGKRRRRIPAHVAVLEAHDRPKPGDEYEGGHGNDIRADNHLPNVEWVTKDANLAKMWETRRQRQALTDTGPGLSKTGDFCQESKVTGGGMTSACLSTGSVKIASSQGTGSCPSNPFFPSVPLPVQPLFHTLRTSFRSLRNRQAA